MLQSAEEFSENRIALKKCRISVENVTVNNIGINNTLRRICAEINWECDMMNRMSHILEASGLLYEKYEEKLLELEAEPVSQPSSEREKSNDEKDSDNENEIGGVVFDYIATWKNCWKMVGNVGAVGGVISGTGTLLTGNGTVKDFVSAAKYFVSAAGNGAVAILKGGAEGAKYAVGWHDALAKIQPDTFGKGVKASISSQVDDLDYVNAKGAAGKVRSATKWAGHLLTVASNGVENYYEWKENGISSGRAVAETVVESAVDITVGIGATAVITAGASAAAAALGTTIALPALAVGAGAAAITIGANAVCKWATAKYGGEAKDLGEIAADAVCNIGEGAINIAKKAKNKIIDTFTASWKGLCGAFA